LELGTLQEAQLFEYLKTYHYNDLIKSGNTYDTFDCVSQKAGVYAELKCRRTHYPDLLIEKSKWDNLVLHAHSQDLDAWYINSTPDGIYAFHLQPEFEPEWSERLMPATTEFGNRSKIGKIVGFLPTSLGKVLYAPLSL
jgi:hypothetical protein